MFGSDISRKQALLYVTDTPLAVQSTIRGSQKFLISVKILWIQAEQRTWAITFLFKKTMNPNNIKHFLEIKMIWSKSFV